MFSRLLKQLASGASEKTKFIIYSIYWIISILAVRPFIIDALYKFRKLAKSCPELHFCHCCSVCSLQNCLHAVFFLVDDIRRGIMWILGKICLRAHGSKFMAKAMESSRSAFLSWLGVGVGGGFFCNFNLWL